MQLLQFELHTLLFLLSFHRILKNLLFLHLSWTLQRLLDNCCLRSTEFVFWLRLLRALATIDVFLISLEDDVIVEGISIKVLLLARVQIATDFIVGVDGLVVAIHHRLLLLLRFLRIRLRILKHTLIHSPPPRPSNQMLLIREVAAVL